MQRCWQIPLVTVLMIFMRSWQSSAVLNERSS